MWPFGKKKPQEPDEDDPLGAIFRLMRDRYWEWSPVRPGLTSFIELSHPSGVTVQYAAPAVYISVTGPSPSGSFVCLEVGDWLRGVNAMIACMERKVRAHGSGSFTDAAVALAKEVLERRDLTAALALADEVTEHSRPRDPG